VKITLNGQDKEFSDSQNLNDIISQFCKDTQRVIAEVNGEIVRGPQWTDTEIKDGDAIELVNFVGGG